MSEIAKHKQLIDEIKTHPACTFHAGLLKPLVEAFEAEVKRLEEENGKLREKVERLESEYDDYRYRFPERI